MKRCPFCAEEIQDEAVFCRYCKHWLNQPTTEQLPINGNIEQSPNVEIGKDIINPLSNEGASEQLSRKQKATLWIIIIAIYSAIYGVFLYQYLIGRVYDMEVANIVFILGFCLATVFIFNWFNNISSLNGFIRFVLAALLAFLLNNLIGFIVGFSIGAQVGFWQGFYDVNQGYQNTPVVETKREKTFATPIPTITNSQTATAISSYNRTQVYKSRIPTPNKKIGEECQYWTEVTLSQKGTISCVYGKAIDTYSRDDAFYVVFGNDPGDFYMISYGSIWYEGMKGNCVMTKGKIEQLGRAPVIVVEENEFFHCE